MKKLRIAIFTDSFLPQVNGVVVGTTNLVESLPRHKFLIVAPEPSKKVSWKPKNASIKFVSPAFDMPTYPEYRVCFLMPSKVLESIKKFKPEIALVQTPFFVGKQGVKFAKNAGIPVIGAYYTLLPDFLMYLPLPFIKHSNFAKQKAWDFGNSFYKKCDLVTSLSDIILEELKKHGLKARMKKIPFGINKAFFKARKAKKSKDFKIAYAGRLSFEKSVDVVLKAFAILEKKFPETRMLLIGDGPARKSLEELAKSLRIERKVEFAGMQSQEKVAELLSECNLAVTASAVETQGIANIEAMALGLPVIAAEAMASKEIVKNGFNGFLFKPFSPEEAAEKAEKVLKDGKLASRLSKNAKEFAKKFSWEKIAKEYEKAFAEEIRRFEGKN